VDDVKNDAAQSDTGYPMKAVGALKASGALKDVSLGVVRFEEPGLKIIRFVSAEPKQQVKFDRIRLLRDDETRVTESKSVVKKPVAPAPLKPSGKSAKSAWNSQDEWNQDRPGFEWVFPFIDQNCDGQIDPTEYRALQQYKKKHGKAWKDLARKDLETTRL